MSDEKRKQPPRWQGQVVRVTVPLEEALAAYELKRLLAGEKLEEAREQALREDEDRGRPLTTVSPGTAPAEEAPDADTTPRRGPGPLTTREAVEDTRRRLRAVDLPHGERSIAKELGVSRDAVRYALGKDRRR